MSEMESEEERRKRWERKFSYSQEDIDSFIVNKKKDKERQYNGRFIPGQEEIDSIAVIRKNKDDKK